VAAPERHPVLDVQVTAGDGSRRTLGEVGADVTVVALWATWCEPCLDELPRIEELKTIYAGDRSVAIIAVNVDDPPALAAAEVRRLGLTLPAYRGGEELMAALAPTGLPLVAVIAGGRVHRRFGFDPGVDLVASLSTLVDAGRRGELPAEPALMVGEASSPMVMALPRMDDAERDRHLPALRAQLKEMFPRFTEPQLDRVIARARELSIEGGSLLIDVPADIPLSGRHAGGGPVPFY
jgi:thiol-disulfide isomerase/thioredoxin